MVSGKSKEAMDLAPEVETIEERQARTRLWGKVKNHIQHTLDQVMALIDGVFDRHDREEMVEILHFSCEFTAALVKDEPLDEPAVWQAYDNSMKLLDIVPLIPSQWAKYYERDEEWWTQHPYWELGERPRPLSKQDTSNVRRLPYKHRLHLDFRPEYEPKYKIPA